MCLIAFAIGASSKWPLVIASNRDEFLARPTLPLARWTTDAGKEVISGRDERAGGTWLGLNPDGRLAMLTNVREPERCLGEKSRGELVTRWLEGDMDADEFMAHTDSAAYGPFNLVLGDFQTASWHWLTNRAATPGWHCRALAPGVYGLSNGALDTPWPKTLALKQALHAALSADTQAALQAGLLQALLNRQRASDGDLPRTGIPLALEHALSSAFVDFPEHGYGTRCSTLLVATADAAQRWDVLVEETTHMRGTDAPLPARSYRLAWEPA
jgi:uncharacterized protein with NRDE domain